MSVQDWVNVLAFSLQDVWLQVVGFLPELILAIIVVIIGLIVAAGLGKFIERIFGAIKLDNFLRQVGVEGFLQRGGLRLNSGHFMGQLVYWFFIVAFLLAASDILGFSAFALFLREVLNYIPRVIVAALILLAAFVAGNFVRGLVRTSVMGAKLHSGKTIATVAWWGVVVFGFLAALSQLGVAVQIINTLITGLIAMLALAGGLAFGLGGREQATQWLNRMRDEMGHR
jgi:hypothetical protein